MNKRCHFSRVLFEHSVSLAETVTLKRKPAHGVSGNMIDGRYVSANCSERIEALIKSFDAKQKKKDELSARKNVQIFYVLEFFQARILIVTSFE